jgi:hypothetical protein
MPIQRQRELGVPDNWRELMPYTDFPNDQPRVLYQIGEDQLVFNRIDCSVDLANMLRQMMPDYFGPWELDPTWQPEVMPSPEPEPPQEAVPQ